MASAKTKIAVGLFVLIGLGIAVVAIVWLGMSRYFEVGRTYIVFFDESIQASGFADGTGNPDGRAASRATA